MLNFITNNLNTAKKKPKDENVPVRGGGPGLADKIYVLYIWPGR